MKYFSVTGVNVNVKVLFIKLYLIDVHKIESHLRATPTLEHSKLGLFGSRKFVYSAGIRSPNLSEFGLESWYSVKFGTEFD